MAIVEVLGFEHRRLDGFVVRPGQLHKIEAAVVVAEAVAISVAGAVVVLQMGGLQFAVGDVRAGGGQAHADHNFTLLVCGRPMCGGDGEAHRQNGGGKLHKSFAHNVLHFSGFQGEFLLTTGPAPW